MLDIIGKRKIFFVISGVLVGAAILAMIVFGFKEGIDFSGGTLWQFKTGNASVSDVQNVFTNDLKVQDARLNYETATNGFLARLPAISESDHQTYTAALKAKFLGFTELSFQSIGPSVGADLRNKSLIALGLVIIGISLYIAFAFRKVYRPVSSWRYGWMALLSLFHDVAIPAGLIALLGHLSLVEVDSNFVVALLVVMGFSVHDTIVVFDRIRENLFLDRGRTDFATVINQSINQTLARSINTSLTLILVLLALFFVGPATLKYFILTLLVGVTTGMYSSIFIASPLLLAWQKVSPAKAKR